MVEPSAETARSRVQWPPPSGRATIFLALPRGCRRICRDSGRPGRGSRHRRISARGRADRRRCRKGDRGWRRTPTAAAARWASSASRNDEHASCAALGDEHVAVGRGAQHARLVQLSGEHIDGEAERRLGRHSRRPGDGRAGGLALRGGVGRRQVGGGDAKSQARRVDAPVAVGRRAGQRAREIAAGESRRRRRPPPPRPHPRPATPASHSPCRWPLPKHAAWARGARPARAFFELN